MADSETLKREREGEVEEDQAAKKIKVEDEGPLAQTVKALEGAVAPPEEPAKAPPGADPTPNPTSSTEAIVIDAEKLNEEPSKEASVEPLGQKRGREEAEQAGEVISSPEKKPKIEPGGEGTESVEEQNEETAPSPINAEDLQDDQPQKIGFKTFGDGRACRDYFARLLANITQNQNINEYEREMVTDLVKKGHPDAPRKIGSGITSIQIQKLPFENHVHTSVFILYRSDGTSDDFSVRKCMYKLFPKYAASMEHEPNRVKRQGRGPKGRGGRGRGRGRRGRT